MYSHVTQNLLSSHAKKTFSTLFKTLEKMHVEFPAVGANGTLTQVPPLWFLNHRIMIGLLPFKMYANELNVVTPLLFALYTNLKSLQKSLYLDP